MEETDIENLVLILEDKKIDYKATPHSIDLQVYDIIGLFLCFNKNIESNVLEKLCSKDDHISTLSEPD